ncbi:MAG: HEAT repeat domain-containing protein [Planctomycetes bacterium]|nr:HEAT repeat domain-containing protein [Planctomycetota bacterium]
MVERVSKVVAWIEDEKLSDAGWDLQAYALGLVEAAGGRGADPALLERLSRSPAPVLRQRLANSLAAVPGDGARAVLEHLLFDETATVRRSAVLTLMKRREPRLLDLLPVLLEDCYIYIRSDAVRAVGELRGTEAARCRALVPVLVSCLEHPWEGEPAAPGTPLAGFQRAGMVDVVESAALALWQVAGDAPGFLRRDPATGKEINDLLDWKKRGEIARRLVEDGEARAAIVAQWRERTDPPPADLRTGALVRRMLEDRDPENVVRAMRELQRLTGDATGFPPAALRRKDDDTEARNAVREWWKADGRAKARPAWEARAGGPR